MRIWLRTRPSPWLVVVLGLFLLAYLYWVCPSDRLVFQRTGVHVADVRVLEELWGVTLSRRDFRGVTAATLQMNPNSPGPGWHVEPTHGRPGVTMSYNDTSRIVLTTREGSIPINRAYTTGLAARQRAVKLVNEFLAAETPSRTSIPVPNGWAVWLVAGFLLFVLVGAAIGSETNCVIDREADQVRLTWKGFLGRRGKEFRLSDVERFQTILADRRTSFSRKGRRRETPTYSLGMRLRNGEEHSLTRESDSWSLTRQEELATMLERFRTGGA